MGWDLQKVAPAFASEVASALEAEGHSELAAQIQGAQIDRCTFDAQVKMGYIYLVRPREPLPFMKYVATVDETIPFAAPHWFNVDVDHERLLAGIELDGRADVIALLRNAGAL